MNSMADSRIQTEKCALVGPVTAVHFLSDSALLVGNGSFVKLYDTSNGELLEQRDVFGSVRVHHFIAAKRLVNEQTLDGQQEAPYLVAVAGGKSMAFIKVYPSLSTSILQMEKNIWQFCDWILDAQWIYAEDDKNCERDPVQLAIIYAHNFVEIWSYPEQKRLNRIYCEEKCLLYAGRFYGHHLSTLKLAVGTVFNKVLLWSLLSELDDRTDCTVDIQFTGHEGVVFKIRFSPDGQQIASVSDDRTICIWALNKPSKPLMTLFGHQARIWDCQFIDDLLISVSEDCTCCVWKMEENREDARRIAIWDGHYSKNAWCLSVNPSRSLVVTGGDDGGVRLWSLASLKQQMIDSSDEMQSVALPESSQYCLGKTLSDNMASKESIRNFVYIEPNKMVVSTFSGYILHHSLLEDTWRYVYHSDTLISYCMMTASPDGSFLVCGSISGQLTLLSVDNKQKSSLQWQPHTEKIFEIFILQLHNNKSIYEILSITWLGDLVWYRYNACTSTLTPWARMAPPPYTVTVSVDFDSTTQLLVCGSREGALLIYDMSTIQLDDIKDQEDNSKDIESISVVKPVWELRRSHGRNAVTSVVFRRTDTAELTVWTTGRDGAYAQWRVHYDQNNDSTTTAAAAAAAAAVSNEERSVKMERIFYSKVTKGWLENIYFMGNELLLGGFFQKRFFLYNETRHYEMLSVACGGAHRRWRFLIQNAKLENTAFAFMRMEKVFVHKVAQSAISQPPPKLQPNFHGREVRTTQWINTTKDPILLSGGEDGYFSNHPCETRLIPYCRVKAHSSVIRASALDNDSSPSLLVTCGGADELRIWRISNAHSSFMESTLNTTDQPTISIHEVSSCPTTSDAFEIRIMDVCLFPLSHFPTLSEININISHIIITVCSDGYVRIWGFSITDKSWQCIAQSNAHGQCVLSCQFTALNNGDNTETGHLHPLLKLHSMHQSGVNTMDVTVQPSLHTKTQTNSCDINSNDDDVAHSHYTACIVSIATGGDDNAFNVIELEATIAEQQLQLTTKQIVHKMHAHASALQGWIVTVSWDLRLQVWQWTQLSTSNAENSTNSKVNAGTNKTRLLNADQQDGQRYLSLVHTTLLNVTDPSALTKLSICHSSSGPSILLAIVGMGIQVVRIAGLPSQTVTFHESV
ncbi:WD40-repeat-containing domain protein [Syncephalis fuscata]|nr:WD40-repeat-containing domain protein [Syncephalis fuscata]